MSWSVWNDNGKIKSGLTKGEACAKVDELVETDQNVYADDDETGETYEP